MASLLVSSKGQIVLPAALRRRLGMGAGARLKVLEEPDGLKLRVVRAVDTADMADMADTAGMAGMVKAPVRGVLLELEWVLRGFYDLPVRESSRVLRALASIEHVTLENRGAVLSAVDAFDKGLDFANALHVMLSSRATGFGTFDRRLAKRAMALGLALPVKLLV